MIKVNGEISKKQRLGREKTLGTLEKQMEKMPEEQKKRMREWMNRPAYGEKHE